MIEAMKQMSLNSTTTGFEHKTKPTRKREFFDKMSLMERWSELVTLTGKQGIKPDVQTGTRTRIRSGPAG